MRIALIQTMQNRLYNFIDPTDSFSFEEASNLQKDMVNQNIKLIERAIEQECDRLWKIWCSNLLGHAIPGNL